MNSTAAESFLETCGAAGPLCVEVEGPDGTPVGRCAVPRPYVLIGRDPARADVRLHHHTVSRRHAYLQVVGGRVFCLDLGSRTGTHLEQGEAMGWLGPTPSIRIGPFRLRAWIGDRPPSAPEPGRCDEPSPLTAAYAQRHHLPGATLVLPSIVEETITYPIDRAVTLFGESALCRVRIRSRGPGASRFYAALIRSPEAAWIIDLRSRAGIRVNGRPVDHARLASGDELQVGPYRMVLAVEGERGGPAPREPEPTSETAPARPVAPGPPENLPAVRPGGEVPEVGRQDRPGPAVPMQQMFDQFQQTMLMMTRMIGSMHRDHMEAVREELARIDQLTRELKAMREASAPGVPGAPSGGPAPLEIGPPSPNGAGARLRLDPEEIDAMVGQRLAAYASERPSPWDRILKLLQSGR